MTTYASILDEPRSELDAATVYAQIGQMPLIRMGARDRYYSDTHVQFDVTCGRAKRRVLITLAPSDTYTVEIGHVQRRTFDWISGEIVHDVYGDSLADVIERLYVTAFEG